MFKVERTQGAAGWESERVDITSPPPAFAVDMGSIEVGWIMFGMGAPDFRMVPLGAPLPAQPSKEHKQGFRVKLAGRVLDGVREFAQTAKCVLAAMDELHSAFLEAPEARAGKIPVVRLSGTTPIVSKGGGQTSTNYKPVFEIIAWTGRDPAMGERTVAAPGVPVAAPVRPAQTPAYAEPAMGAPPPHVTEPTGMPAEW
jgi:hypothetical protein